MPDKIQIKRRTPNLGKNRLPSDLHPVLARIYLARDVSSEKELDYALGRLQPPESLKDIDKATALLKSALDEQQRILVVGDYDADGATATTLAMRALREFGAKNIHFLVPDRFIYGYGLTPEIVDEAVKFQPDLIITVDNGIASVAGVAAAHTHGIKVLITDHHLPGLELPDAEAIVNPNQAGDHFPSKVLAGVGVIFYVLLALRTHLRDSGWFEKHKLNEPNLGRFLDLVALGTIADLVPLDHNNRILVDQGLRRIRAGQCCPGLLSIARAGKRNPERLTEGDLGFFIAPRINAAGRLDDMSIGIQCLLTDDPAIADEYASQLDKLNLERRNIQDEMHEQANVALDTLAENKLLPLAICLYHENWHEGVVGLVASKVKDKTHRPAIAFAPASDNLLKGSARSVSGLHIRDALDAMASGHPGLIQKFGGHAMAAGLTISREKLEEFKAVFIEEVSRHLSEDDLKGVVISDGELSLEDLGLSLAETLERAGPWGQGFPEPLFDGEFHVVDQKVIKDKHLKMKLRHLQGGELVDAIAFNHIENPGDELVPKRIRAVYKLAVNEYKGWRNVQLLINCIEPLDG